MTHHASRIRDSARSKAVYAARFQLRRHALSDSSPPSVAFPFTPLPPPVVVVVAPPAAA